MDTLWTAVANMELSPLNTALLGIVLLIACLLVSQRRFSPSLMAHILTQRR
jgi:hypothetical protein